MSDQIPRQLRARIERALSAYRVVIVGGPRQVGKTTLAKELLSAKGTFRQLDKDETLAAAIVDPLGFATVGTPPRGKSAASGQAPLPFLAGSMPFSPAILRTYASMNGECATTSGRAFASLQRGHHVGDDGRTGGTSGLITIRSD
ncbi:hypothetical protein DQ384_16985 [Sphaerisporangium album]|uniref:AAA domain-containing protein n=1 Tax=Sphaerisporangium album TaxID=509200 RepID=A0A367FIY6_9ACTN|nr:hypothetical protein [Sphaerisporangium album]RCG29869.1 hypothetical protein DQ384_16985 [Sphaerisporangium album]